MKFKPKLKFEGRVYEKESNRTIKDISFPLDRFEEMTSKELDGLVNNMAYIIGRSLKKYKNETRI